MTALHAFRRTMARRALAPVDVLCVGTSTVFGTGASALETTFTARLGEALGARGAHYLPTHPGWTRSGNWANVGKDFGQASVSLTGYAFVERTITGTGVRVLYRQGSSVAPTFVVAIDDMPHTVTVQQGVSSAYDGVWDSPPLSPGTHTVRVTAPAGTVELGGLYAYDGDESSGVRVWCGGTPGVTSAAWTPNAPGAASHWRRAGSLDPALLVMMVSSNDYASQVDPAAFKANVKAAVEFFRLACLAPPVLLVHTYRRLTGSSGAHAFGTYGQQLAALASEMDDVDYLDAGVHFPVSQVADVDDLVTADNVHPSDTGHQWLADIVADRLTGPLPSPPSTAAGTVTSDPATWPGLVSAWRASDLPAVDGDPVTSWAPYAGTETAPLAQATVARRPAVRVRQVGVSSAVEFRQPAGSTGGSYLTTTTWSTPASAVTVVAVARLDRNFGNVYSGISNAHLSMMILGGDMTMGMMSGAATNGGYVTTGANRWAVYVAVHNGPESRFWQSGWPAQNLTIPTHASAGLSGLTLAANAAGGNTGNVDVAEMLVFNRPLTDAEAQGCIDVLVRRYGIDRSGRTSV